MPDLFSNLKCSNIQLYIRRWYIIYMCEISVRNDIMKQILKKKNDVHWISDGTIGQIKSSRLWIYGPRHEKTCLLGFPQSEFQTGLLSYGDEQENMNFTCSKFTYEPFQKPNNKGADQTAWMRRLVCTCVVRKPPETGFLTSRPIFCLDMTKRIQRIKIVLEDHSMHPFNPNGISHFYKLE